MTRIGAVVGHDGQAVGAGGKLLLQDHQVAVAEADDRGDACPKAVEFLGQGERDRTANAATHDADLADSLGMRGNAERTNEVGDAVALILFAEEQGRGANGLEDDLDGACLAVAACHREGNALALLVDAQDDELSFLATRGASISIWITVGLRIFLRAIRYMEILLVYVDEITFHYSTLSFPRQ